MELLRIAGAEIYFDPHFLPAAEATQTFGTLMSRCAWQRRPGPFGYPVPRDEAYYGDPGTHYTYSRREYQPLPWIPELFSLKTRVEDAIPEPAYANLHLPRSGFNAVLCNLYRDGNDSVGLHSDDEPEMGPIIASLSLGAERHFRLRHRRTGSIVFSEPLPDGSLLIMAGKTQESFRHDVPKEPAVTRPRINLTFRRISHR